jgi:single-strand DNA-binding protein
MNICSFTGRITADLELRNTTSGISVCSFTLAVKRPRAKDETDFIKFTAFRQTAEYLTSYAKKGSLVEVSGALRISKWEDNNGNKREKSEIIVDNASILESKNAPSVDVQADPLTSFAKKIDDFTEVDADGDLPFN